MTPEEARAAIKALQKDPEFLADIVNTGRDTDAMKYDAAQASRHEAAQAKLAKLQDAAYGRIEDEPDFKGYMSNA